VKKIENRKALECEGISSHFGAVFAPTGVLYRKISKKCEKTWKNGGSAP
jgi:hypothetical protein